MPLQSIEFTRNPGRAKQWRLEPLELGPVNLIVGRNASGKTQALSVITALARLITGEARPKLEAGSFKARLALELDKRPAIYEYELVFEGANVARESLRVDGAARLIRGAGRACAVHDAASGREREVEIPPDHLAVAAPLAPGGGPGGGARPAWLEPLAAWAAGVRRIDFASGSAAASGSTRFRVGVEPPGAEPPNLCATYQRALADFGPDFRRRVIEDMGRVGYPIEDLAVGPLTCLGAEVAGSVGVCLRVKEPQLAEPVEQPELSQAMSRSLALLTRLNAELMRGGMTLAVIDDIGEGLDFERSRSMIELLMERVAEANVQLVISTNDRFVMNRVPLELWSLLWREGGVIKVFNERNSKEIFEDFKFTGLSNFDFLSTDFVHSAPPQDFRDA